MFHKGFTREKEIMSDRLKKLGVVLIVVGLLFVIGGGYAFTQVQNGYDSLQAFSAEQNVELAYNEDGLLVDRGATEGAEAIMSLLVDDWKFNVVEGDLDPNDPLVNTATEYMFQMATINYHILHGTQTIVLTEDVPYNGEVFTAGTYDFAVEGRYWTDFDRSHPLEGPARSQAWSGTAHGLVGELGVGAVTHSALQLGLALAGVLAAFGGTMLLTGAGLMWVGKKQDASVVQTSDVKKMIVDYRLEEMTKEPALN
jgi:hypothetical protein